MDTYQQNSNYFLFLAIFGATKAETFNDPTFGRSAPNGTAHPE